MFCLFASQSSREIVVHRKMTTTTDLVSHHSPVSLAIKSQHEKLQSPTSSFGRATCDFLRHINDKNILHTKRYHKYNSSFAKYMMGASQFHSHMIPYLNLW